MLSAIILAAGQGRRLKTATPKPLIKIGKLSAIVYSLNALDAHPGIDEVIVVVSTKNRRTIIRQINKFSFKKIVNIVIGGSRRQDSVYNGLKMVSEKSAWVLIHDSARPFIDGQSIAKVITAAKKTGAAILGVPVKATIKSSKFNGLVDRTLNRANLWEIQTPQVFRKELIFRAYKKYSTMDVTDDSSLVEKLGNKVKIVSGSYENVKITTQEDLLFARAIAGRKR